MVKYKIALLTPLLFSLVSANDLYRLDYSKANHECNLTKNGKTIPLFDKRNKKW
jgi:hypothetical protein